MKLIIPISLLLFTSCSSYINQMHKEFDQDENKGKIQGGFSSSDDQFDFYRKKRPNHAGRPSSRAVRNMKPSVQRKYEPVSQRKRYKADDLYDNGNSNSLWSGSSNNNYLFSVDTVVNEGDIVVINVQEDMKKDITRELVRAFPTRIKKKTTKKTTEATPAGEASQTPANNPAPASTEDVGADTKIYDRISSVVLEEINSDHLLIRGRKYLLFRGSRRIVELQALVARRDLRDDKSVNSEKVLEQTIKVIK